MALLTARSRPVRMMGMKAMCARLIPGSGFAAAVRGLVLPPALVAAAGCASGGVTPGSEGVWREDMGRMTKATVVAGLDRVVRRHSLKVDRQEDRPREFYYELAWIPRDVTAEEEIFGVTDARNRIVIEGRTSGAGGGDPGAGLGVYRVSWKLENEVVSMTNPEWRSGRIPESVIERFRPVFSDLAMEVRSGMER